MRDFWKRTRWQRSREAEDARRRAADSLEMNRAMFEENARGRAEAGEAVDVWLVADDAPRYMVAAYHGERRWTALPQNAAWYPTKTAAEMAAPSGCSAVRWMFQRINGAEDL